MYKGKNSTATPLSHSVYEIYPLLMSCQDDLRWRCQSAAGWPERSQPFAWGAQVARRRGMKAAGRRLWAGAALVVVALAGCTQGASGADSEADQYTQAMAQGRAALERKDYDAAIREAKTALDVHPADQEAHRLLAKAEQGQRDRVNYDHAFELARAKMGAGDYAAAADLMRLVLQGWPDDARAKEMLAQAQVHMASTPSDDQGRRDRVNYNHAFEMARTKMAAGDYAAAADLMRLVLEGWPNDPRAKQLLAQAQSGMATVPSGTQSPKPYLAADSAAGTNAYSFETIHRKPPKNEVSASGDILYGQGHVTLPIFFSLGGYNKNGEDLTGLHKTVVSPNRDSVYEGGTLSYSRGTSWFLDLSYAEGSSSGTENLTPLSEVGGATSTHFNIDESYYQGYVRYLPKRFLTTPFTLYFRAGFTYVDSKLTDAGLYRNSADYYSQTDKTTDYLGNLGFGVSRNLIHGDRLSVLLQVEGEGFGGERTQKSQENFPNLAVAPVHGPTANINNTVYGGIGRGTVRFQYAFGKYGYFKAFADGGFEAKYTEIQYTGLGSFDEILWGPYGRIGLRYDF